MDPNRVAAAPHEPDGGGRRPGARARAAFGPLVLGAEMAPMEKLRDGRGTDLWWLPLGGHMQQPTERWCRWGGGALERRCERAERVREDMYPSFRAAIRVTKK